MGYATRKERDRWARLDAALGVLAQARHDIDRATRRCCQTCAGYSLAGFCMMGVNNAPHARAWRSRRAGRWACPYWERKR